MRGGDGISGFTSRSGAPVVSVVVPTYKYGHFISDALASLQRQTLDAWECIVIDDGSVDDTGAVVATIARADPRVRYHHQPNRGLSAARNAGLVLAVGRYVQLLDADDAVQPRKLQAQASFLDDRPEIDVVSGAWGYWDGSDALRGEPHHGQQALEGEGREVVETLLRGNVISVNAPLVRLSAIRKVGLFDERLHAHEDWEYWLRMALAHRRFAQVELPEAMALVRIHTTSLSRDRARMLSGLIAARRRVAAELGTPWQRDLNRTLLGDAEVWLGTRIGVHGSLRRGLAMVARGAAHRRNPADILRLLALPVAATRAGRAIGRRVWPSLFSERSSVPAAMNPKEQDPESASG